MWRRRSVSPVGVTLIGSRPGDLVDMAVTSKSSERILMFMSGCPFGPTRNLHDSAGNSSMPCSQKERQQLELNAAVDRRRHGAAWRSAATRIERQGAGRSSFAHGLRQLAPSGLPVYQLIVVCMVLAHLHLLSTSHSPCLGHAAQVQTAACTAAVCSQVALRWTIF